jgi:preprotein translocase subunit SecG
MGFLTASILVLFVFSAFFLILLVMIQSGKGGGLGGLGGGASQTAFGSSSADVMTKTTRIVALSFVVVAFLLSFLFAKKETIIAPAAETIQPEIKEAPAAKDVVPTKDAPAAKDVVPAAKETIPAPAKQ